MNNINEYKKFENTNFKPEAKDDYARIRMSKQQKKALKMMAKRRNMTVTELIMTLLQYEKDNSIVLNNVIEKDKNNLKEEN